MDQTSPSPINQAQLYRALLHQDNMTYYRMHWYLMPMKRFHIRWTPPPANRVLMYRALLHQDSMTYWKNTEEPSAYWQIQTYPGQMVPCYLTPSVHSPTTPEKYDLLQNALLCSTHWYPLLLEPTCTESYYTRTVCAYWYPPNWAPLYRAQLHQDSMTYYRICCYLLLIDHHPSPIETTCTEPYYTRTVWHCRMQMYPVPINPPI